MNKSSRTVLGHKPSLLPGPNGTSLHSQYRLHTRDLQLVTDKKGIPFAISITQVLSKIKLRVDLKVFS